MTSTTDRMSEARSLVRKPYDFTVKEAAGKTHIPGLNGMRAIAVMLVIIAHYGFQDVVPGGLGVTIFFFISGFLICTLLLREQEKSGTIAIKAFYVRRFLRLAPEMYVFVGLTALYFFVRGVPVELGRAFAAVAYWMNYYKIFNLSSEGSGIHWGHLWSLAVEEHFYLTFPLLVLALVKVPKRLMLLLTIILIVCPIYRAFTLIENFPGHYTYYASEARADSLAYGCLLACLARYSEGAVALFRRFANPALPLGILVLLATLVLRNEFFRETIRYSLQGIGIGMIFIGLYYGSLGPVLLEWLETPIADWLGKLSYAIYLWHFILLNVIDMEFGVADMRALPMGQHLLLTAVMTVISIALAQASYLLVYQNFVRLRRNWGSHAA
ncbi:acyltransferase [Altericroceibacterium spongiae]|uniref:Acyltransferase n=1 Tax=Altericroceibacterium spongiae TaxID=2320269 RepID=A0A420E9G8_9SPHN|nr:acyltransferase [Altericroceibacterium spongiae]RKF15974.1 acyltransferase [Altericroceibacterium spongiae]